MGIPITMICFFSLNIWQFVSAQDEQHINVYMHYFHIQGPIAVGKLMLILVWIFFQENGIGEQLQQVVCA